MNQAERFYYAMAHRERICVWLRANGIDPGVVPMEAVVTVDGQHIRCPVYVLNARGQIAIDAGTRHPARRILVQPLVAEPGETVARWLVIAQPEGANP